MRNLFDPTTSAPTNLLSFYLTINDKKLVFISGMRNSVKRTSMLGGLASSTPSNLVYIACNFHQLYVPFDFRNPQSYLYPILWSLIMPFIGLNSRKVYMGVVSLLKIKTFRILLVLQKKTINSPIVIPPFEIPLYVSLSRVTFWPVI